MDFTAGFFGHLLKILLAGQGDSFGLPMQVRLGQFGIYLQLCNVLLVNPEAVFLYVD